MQTWHAERSLIVQKILGLNDKNSDLDKDSREFLVNYFQIHEDISNTHIYYPVKFENSRIVFEKLRLFGCDKEKSLAALLKSRIVGMIYFYANFNKDMSLSPSEKLRVNLFLDNSSAKDNDISDTKNLPYIDSVDGITLMGLRAIYESYLRA